MGTCAHTKLGGEVKVDTNCRGGFPSLFVHNNKSNPVLGTYIHTCIV